MPTELDVGELADAMAFADTATPVLLDTRIVEHLMQQPDTVGIAATAASGEESHAAPARRYEGEDPEEDQPDRHRDQEPRPHRGVREAS